MTIATVMVYVDPKQQAEGQVRIARDAANKFGASLIGVSAFAVGGDFSNAKQPAFGVDSWCVNRTTFLLLTWTL